MKEQYTLELLTIVTELNKLLPQLQGFILNFNQFITEHGLNVITDGSGQLSIDVPSSMSDTDIDKCVKKVGILDRLINNQFESINTIFTKGYDLEANIKKLNSEHLSLLTEKSKILTELKNSYKH